MNQTKILKEVLSKINPPEEEMGGTDRYLKSFIPQFEKKLKTNRISAEIFVGGSFAKKTLIKKGRYDIDVFVRFDEKHKGQDISKITEKALRGFKAVKIHGSRDYFRLDINPVFFVEIIPVRKVSNPKIAENITDLSYFHVNYIKRKMKKEKLLEDIRLAKAFCHANKCYGAESYVNGFSGYAIELLVLYYRGFMNFIRAVAKIKGKEIIDIEKLYKNKYEIAMNMNSAKMNSPVVLIDPTYRERNALAALSGETFSKFQEACRKFLKKPSKEAFEIKETDIGRIKKNAKKSRAEFILLSAETDRQEGDVAGSKLMKFYRHLSEEIRKFYNVSNTEFSYGEAKEAEFFFTAKKKREIIQQGPDLRDKQNTSVFRKHHRNTFVRGNRLYARDKFDKSIKEFIEGWKRDNSKRMKEMNITKLDVIEI
jgi:tRNA nucleotidyltransferase (CCA-adding enzyme)